MESDYKIYHYKDSTITVSGTEWEYNWPLIVTNIIQGPATVIGLLVNAFLLFLIAVTPHLRTPSNILLLQRAIADIFALFPFLFIMYFRVVGFSEISVYLCKFISLILHIGAVASLVFLMGFAIHNYQASNPKHFTSHYRIKTTRIVSILAWVFGIITGLVAFFITFLGGYCDFAPLYNHISVVRILIQMTVLFIIPLVVVWVYINITPPRPSGDESESMGEGEASEHRNPRLVLRLASIFTVLHVVYWFFIVLHYFVPNSLARIVFSMLSSFTIYTEASNAILVFLLSEEVRQEAVTWLRLSHRRRDSLPLQ